MSFDRFSPSRNLSATPAELGSFMSGVYAWMTLGLAITAFTGYTLTLSPDFMQILFSTPFAFLGVGIVQVLLVLGLSAMINRISPVMATALYLIYSLLSGVTFSVYFIAYQLGSIAEVFGITAMMFGSLALFGYVTKKDLSGMGTFLFMGLIGLIIASIVNIFLHNPMMDMIISAVGVLLFAGLTAFDVQRIKGTAAHHLQENGASSLQKLTIIGSLQLYLDFINMFIFLLRLFGNRR